MSEEELAQPEERWAIDLDWLKNRGRNFIVLAGNTLCDGCRKKLKVDTLSTKPADLLKAIRNCCSKSPDYITPSLPLQESIFRAFLANGNKPLTLGELSEQLNQRRGVDAYRTSTQVLSRLLKNDQYYGIKSKTI